jgi:hypothetical protein
MVCTQGVRDHFQYIFDEILQVLRCKLTVVTAYRINCSHHAIRNSFAATLDPKVTRLGCLELMIREY